MESDDGKTWNDEEDWRNSVVQAPQGAAARKGPARILFLGGTLTAGRGLKAPFVEQITRALGEPAACCAVPNAGVDAYLAMATGPQAGSAAAVTVIETPGIHGLSNRFYRVHRKRNDRFIAPEPPLKALFPNVDFAGINFVGHLTRVLRAENPAAYALVEAELRAQWARKMRELIGILGPKVLLMTPRPEDETGPRADVLAGGVTQEMLEDLAAQTGARVLECVLPEPRSLPYPIVPGPLAHDLIARRLITELRGALPRRKGEPAVQGPGLV
ncbi:hypothetical protein PSA7680_03159 [Pseudoruegeria aquimaris]|uniref:DUF6473 domain-containing protein n=1 Tax=Pseudoruegeria aquimaris TaxID=393663 RepID=A0A1Y5TEL4_9RHOB|nr:DUF6473 family protein [Pseudoruegeria aquimaris]SLN60190.1 hypothetical protein PSA7680_03159 [Pseudoruegeria aquimaris]